MISICSSTFLLFFIWTQQTPTVEINPAGQFPSTFSIWINFNPFSFFHCSFLLQNQIQFHLGTFWFQSFQSILIPTHLLSFWYWSIHCNVNQNIFENNGDFDQCWFTIFLLTLRQITCFFLFFSIELKLEKILFQP